MPTTHVFGSEGTAVNYCLDSVTGLPVAVQSTGGAQAVAVVPGTTGGLLTRKVIATADTNAAVVKGSAGQVFGVELANNAAYAVFVKFFNKATLPTVGTDVPVWTIQVPAGGRAEINRPAGVSFAAGIGMCAVKLVADNDVTPLVAADVVGSVHYK